MKNKQELKLEVGDIVFTYLDFPVFKNITKATGCWSNHVGIIVGHDGLDYIVAESKVPISSFGSFNKFISRSKNKRYEVRRLINGISDEDKKLIYKEALLKRNLFYHLGFKFDSRLQFCSKFVYEIYRDVLGIELGKLETFKELLNNAPSVNLIIWRFWFLGHIPWKRKTITPASLYFCPKLKTIYE